MEEERRNYFVHFNLINISSSQYHNRQETKGGKTASRRGKNEKKIVEEGEEKVILYLIFPPLEGKGKKIKVSYLNSEAFKIFITFLRLLSIHTQ